MTNWYQNIGFRWKLTLPMILLVVVFLYTAIYSIRSSGTLAKNAETIAKVNFPEIELLMQADRDLYQALTAERALLSGNWSAQEWRALATEHAENIQQAHDRTLRSFELSDTGTAAERQEFLRHLQAWQIFTTDLIASAQSGDTDSNRLLLEQSFNEGYRLFSTVRTFIDIIGERRLQHVENFTVQIENDSASIASTLVLLAIIGTLIVLAATLLLPMLVTVPLRAISDRIRNIAEGDGDLTIRLQIDRRDELGELAEHVNRFMEKLQNLIGNIRRNSEDVSGSAELLLSVSGSSRQAAGEQFQAITMVVAAVNELTVAIQEVAHNTSDTAQNARAANQITDEGQARIHTAVERVKGLLTRITQTAEIMVRLEEEAKKVTSVIDVIRGVAEQTNLLALNAAIEAARAGEQGRGLRWLPMKCAPWQAARRNRPKIYRVCSDNCRVVCSAR